MRVILRNGTIITPYRVLQKGSLVIEREKIVKVVPHSNPEINDGDTVIDVGGKYVAPGFIDIHSHGGGGHDFMDGTPEAFIEGARAHLSFGTTSILPTTLTSTMDELFKSLDSFHQAQQIDSDGPELLGLHLEGPYFAMEQKGAQDPRYIKDPVPEEYIDVLNYSNAIKRWTIAPELPGAMAMASYLRERGVVCSIGHSNAIADEVEQAVESGFSLVTHLYSAMSTVRRINAYRYAGVVESSLLLDDLFVEIIADGSHLPKSLLQLVYKTKGPDAVCLVTDSMRAAGMPEGRTILGSLENGYEVIVEDGVAKLLDRSAFAGSVCTADRLVRNMVQLAQVPLIDAIRMITLTPARVLNVHDRKGSLSPGKEADVVVFDADINVSMVLTKGKVCYSKEAGVQNENI